MNKFEKIALQCAKDDMNKGYDFVNLKKSKSGYLAVFKKDKFLFSKALAFKNWNKTIVW